LRPILIVIGIVVRWFAILILRKYFTVNVAIQKGHVITQTGLYKYIRHLSYLGTLLSFFGLWICMSNWISICILIIPISYALVNRMQIEEQALKDASEKEYLNYCSKTCRLIPKVY